jgi:quaternary ammonium compound-resistance protein SugE
VALDVDRIAVEQRFYISGQCCNLVCRRMVVAWILLLVAGLLEVGWAIGLKYTEGFSRFWPSLATVSAMVVSVVLLGIAMKSLPVGTSYAVWVGVGAVGTAILGIVLFGEPATAGRLFSLGLIVAGIVGLKLASPV